MRRRPATGPAPAPTPSGRPRRSSRSGLFPSAGSAQPAGTALENLPPRRRAPGFHSPFNLSEWLHKPFRPLRSTPPQRFPCPDLFRMRPLSRLRAVPLPFPMAPLFLPVAFLPLPVTPLPEPVAHLRPNPGPDPKPGRHPDPGPALKPGRAPVPKPRRLPGPGLRAAPIPSSSPGNRRPKRLRRFPSRLQLCLPPLPRLPLRRLRPRHHPLLRHRPLLPPCLLPLLRLPLRRLRPRHHPLLRRRLLLPPCRPLPRLPLRRP